MMRPLSTVALTHLAANALVLGLGYYWLGVPESRGVTLAWSVSIAFCILVQACWTYSAGLVYFRQMGEGPKLNAWRISLRNILPFALAVIAVALLYWLLARWADYSARPAFRIASYLTLKLRSPVRPSAIARVFDTFLWLVRWMVLPVLLLPRLSAIAALGWRGIFAPRPLIGKWLYWIQTPALLFCAVRIPVLLLQWLPRVNGFALESASFVLRASIAYLLFGCAWLVLAFVTSDGSPRLTQPSTAVSP
jgi:hypothetical protein